VNYESKKTRMMKLIWKFKDSHEQLNVTFQKEEEMNKFDMLLYLVSLNNSNFKSNSFSAYFDDIKHPDLPIPYPKDYRKNQRVPADPGFLSRSRL